MLHDKPVAIDKSTVRAALDGDRASLSALIDAATPVLHMCAWRAIARRRPAGQDIRVELEDLVQEVFVALFSAEGGTLRKWDPDKGCSFASFVGLVARRRIANILRSRTAGTHGHQSEMMDSSAICPNPDPEQATGSRQILEALVEHLEATLSPRALDMFERLFVRQEAVETVAEAAGLSHDAVYQWRTRLRAAARRALLSLQNGSIGL